MNSHKKAIECIRENPTHIENIEKIKSVDTYVINHSQWYFQASKRHKEMMDTMERIEKRLAENNKQYKRMTDAVVDMIQSCCDKIPDHA